MFEGSTLSQVIAGAVHDVGQLDCTEVCLKKHEKVPMK